MKIWCCPCNFRTYPILHEFLPIYYDGEVTILNTKVDDFFLDFENNNNRSEYDKTHYPIPPYSVSVGINGIKEYLDKVDIELLQSQLKSRGLFLSKSKLQLVLERILNRYERLRAVKIKQPDLNLNPAIYKKYFNNNSDKLIYKD